MLKKGGIFYCAEQALTLAGAVLPGLSGLVLLCMTHLMTPPAMTAHVERLLLLLLLMLLILQDVPVGAKRRKPAHVKQVGV